jgi:hypothetical protein
MMHPRDLAITLASFSVPAKPARNPMEQKAIYQDVIGDYYELEVSQ